MTKNPKRTVPSNLQFILELDESVTKSICNLSCRFTAPRAILKYGKFLEYSCHGIIWIALWLALMWGLWIKSWFEIQVNFFNGLILDIVLVAILKSIFRRRRPKGNQKDTLEIGPDQYSFPSGHVSRSFYIAYFFIYVTNCPSVLVGPILLWALAVSYSRILLKKHHLLDVIAGVFCGLFVGLVISYLWVNKEVSFYLIEWLTDEKLNGGDE